MPSTTATIPATVPPAIAPTFVLDGPELEPEPLDEPVLPLLLVAASPPEFPAVVLVFSVIMVSRSGSLQPFVGGFFVDSPVLLLGD